MVPGLASTIPRSTSSFLVPRSSTPTLSPALAESSSLRNISMSVATVLRVSFKPDDFDFVHALEHDRAPHGRSRPCHDLQC